MLIVIASLGVLASLTWPHSNLQLVSIGDRRLAIDCSGFGTHSPTIVLMAGGNRTSGDWSPVQRDVSAFAHVCSYDIAGLGKSESAGRQSVDEIVNDLHLLLEAAGEKPPYILVAHSWAGIQARKFSARSPNKVVGMVLVDSSHEEQAWRLYDLKPADGALGSDVQRRGYFVNRGERLSWQTDIPLVVIARGRPLPKRQVPDFTDEQIVAWERTWQDLQKDLARRSPRGELRFASKSGHMIPRDQPDVIVAAVRDVLARAHETHDRTD